MMIVAFHRYEEALPTLKRFDLDPKRCFSVCRQYIHADNDRAEDEAEIIKRMTGGLKISKTENERGRKKTIVDCTEITKGSGVEGHERAISTLAEHFSNGGGQGGETRILV